MRCLKCEKALQMVDGTTVNPDGAGELLVSFHYGSSHDQCLGRPYRSDLTPTDPSAPRHQFLLVCDQIRAYICDDCFVTHSHLFEGWSLPNSLPSEKVL